MASHIAKPPEPACNDEGCIALIVPFGAARSRRIVIPHETAEWLLSELGKALAEIAAERKGGRP
jgi:hypothetical protein